MNAIELNDLEKRYRDFTLGPLNLTLPCGCIMGLIGENGAGKSTTIRLLLQMLKPSAGSFTLFGQDGADDLTALKEDIGVVLDEIGLPDCLTTAQVEKIMRHTYRQWDTEAYEGYLARLDIPQGKPIKAFSSGNKMKLGIALAMSHRPKLLLLDEATNGLDPIVREDVMELLLEFTRDESHTILISSHIVSDLEKICDYIVFLHKGQIVLCDEKDHLLERYASLHCTREQFAEIDEGAVLGHRSSPYGVDAVVTRGAVPAQLACGAVTVEDLFVLMAKEDA